jgi:hypothetical protein
LWENKIVDGVNNNGSELDNCIFHQKCLELYRRIKALVFKQCRTDELEEALKDRN